MKKVCIQGEGASARIKSCRFRGPCKAGIEWRDQKGELIVQSCTFNELLYGISFTNCDSIQMLGNDESSLKLTNCENALWLRNCKGVIDGAQITGNRTSLKRGIAIQENSEITLINSLVSGYETGIAVNQAQLHSKRCNIEDCTTSSFQLKSGQATLEEIEMVGTGPFNLHVLGSKSVLTVDDGLFMNSTSGIWVESGNATLNRVLVQDCQVGIIAGLNDEFAKAFSDRGEEPSTETDPDSPPTEDAAQSAENGSQPKIEGNDIRFTTCRKGVVFVGPGQLAFKKVDDDFQNDNKKRVSTLNKDLLGIGDINEFKAQWKTVRDRAIQ